MNFFNAVKKYWYIIASAVVIVTIASFIVSIIQTPEYQSTVQLLVIQKQKDNADAYTATRSAETVAGILSKVIYTSTFFDQVMSSGFEIDKNTYSKDLEERKKEWEKAVDARVVGDTGTLQIDVYDKNRNQAEQLAYAIAYVVINNGKQYHGAESQIETKLIDAPITTDKIARPNIALNIFAGFILGLMTSLAIIFLLSERKPREKYTAGMKVKTMPKIENKKDKKLEKSSHSIIKKLEKRIEPQKTSVSKVKERIASELKEYKKNVEQPIASPINIRIEPKEIKQIPKKEVKSRLASGMDSLGISKIELQDERVPSENNIIYSSEDIQENYKKIEEDKYSPDKVERWIKTGKFE